MASADRSKVDGLIALLEQAGQASSFFEVVRALQQLHPEAVQVGHQGPPAREVVRFRPPLDLSFGASEVDGVFRAPGGGYEIACRFLALYGAASPLPASYTEELLFDDRHGRLRDFFDIFNHRLISFFYRAWEKYRHSALFDGRGSDPTTRRARILVHLERDGDPVEQLRFAGLLHQQPLSEYSLQRILSASLGVPIEVHSCRIRWVEIPGDQRSALGRTACELGALAPLGDRVRSATTAFAIAIGPLGHDDYCEFLPGGRQRARLCTYLDHLDIGRLDCEIETEIATDAVRPAELGGDVGGLGWTTWLGADAPRLAGDRRATVLNTLYRPAEPCEVA